MSRIEPYEKWFSRFMLPLDKIFGCCNKFIIAGFHPFFCEGPCILNFLLAYFSPPRHFCRIIFVCSPGMDNTARSKCFKEFRKFLLWRIVIHFRLFFCVEVIKIAKELVEPMIGRQHMVKVAQMVLAELPCSIILFLQQCGYRHYLFIHPDWCARYTYFGQAGAVNTLPSNE